MSSNFFLAREPNILIILSLGTITQFQEGKGNPSVDRENVGSEKLAILSDGVSKHRHSQLLNP